MSSPYVGECRLVGFSFAPAGWALCQGQLVPISENDTLFNLIGTTYGGDGQSTFGLPDLQGRTPIHQGTNGTTFIVGEKAGTETVTINIQTLPNHNHGLLGSTVNGNTTFPQNGVLAANPTFIYVTTGPPNPTRAMNPLTITNVGNSQPHENLQPYLTMSWVISLFGVFPTQ